MAKYGIVCIIMKITVTIPDDIYRKLEEDRGLIPRSSFIQELIRGWRGSETKPGEFSTGVSMLASKPKDTGSNPVAPARKSSEPIKSSTPDKKEVRPKREKLDKLVRDGVVKRGVKELPSQEVDGFKTYFKNKGN